jgi:type IV secretion system protein VirB10
VVTPGINNAFNINDIKQPEAPKEIDTNAAFNLKMPEPPKIEIQQPKEPEKLKEEKLILPPVFGQIDQGNQTITPVQQKNEQQQENPKLRKRNASVLLFGGGGGPSEDETPEEKKKNEMLDLITGKFGKKKTNASSFAKVTDSYVGLKDRMLLAGKMIDLVLETRISTAQDGMIRAVVSSDVYSESGYNILIPAGSRVIGNYSNQKNKNSYIVEIALTRIVRPDGIDIMLGGMPLTDKLGGSGVRPDKVHTGIGKSIMNSLVMGALSLGSLFVSKRIDDTTQNNITFVPNPLIPGQLIAVNNGNTDFSGAVKDSVDSVTSNLRDRFNNDNQDPIFIVNQGRKLSIMTNKDIVFSDENAFIFYPGEISALMKENCNK